MAPNAVNSFIFIPKSLSQYFIFKSLFLFSLSLAHNFERLRQTTPKGDDIILIVIECKQRKRKNRSILCEKNKNRTDIAKAKHESI